MNKLTATIIILLLFLGIIRFHSPVVSKEYTKTYSKQSVAVLTDFNKTEGERLKLAAISETALIIIVSVVIGYAIGRWNSRRRSGYNRWFVQDDKQPEKWETVHNRDEILINYRHK